MQAFKRIKLGQALTFQRGFDITKAEQTRGSIPIVSSSGVSSYHNVAKVDPPGVIIGRKGTLGTVHAVNTPFWPHDTTLWVKDFKGNDPRFLYYFLKTLHLENFDTGSSNPTLNRNHLHKIEVVFPVDVDVQLKIAGILSAYDDLIENNRRRIAILERMAEELYREWFVRMRFPGYQNTKFVKGVPEGWEMKKLPELTNITYGFPFKADLFNNDGIGMPIVRIRNIIDSSTADYTTERVDERYIIEAGDFLIGMDGEFHMNHWCGEKALLVQRTCRVKAKSELLSTYISLALRAPIKHLEATVVGATVAHLGAKHLNVIDVVVPPKSMESHLHLLNKLRDEKVALARSVRKLGMTRNALLARLVSGKLDVSTLDPRLPKSMPLGSSEVHEELAHA